MNNLVDLETKLSVVPGRLLDSIIDDALVVAVGRLNQYLPSGVSIDISAVGLTPIRDQLRGEVAARLTEIGVTVSLNDPVISAIIARYSEILNGHFQTEGLQIESYVWRSRDDARVRSSHAEYDDQTFSWSDPPSGGHPGQGWNCRCTAEPIIDLESIPEGGVCDILTGDRLASVFPDADADRLAQIAREVDMQIVAARLDSPNRLAHFFGQVQQEVGLGLSLVESLDYRADRLGSIFRYFRRNPDEALLFGRTTDHPADQEAIANRAYADRNGNGGVESGDGWRFRGRGLKQVTGRANYRAFTEDHAQLFGEWIDFEAEPELLGTPRFAARSALWFWRANDLFTFADAGISRAAADSITAIINPGTDSYAERWENVQNLNDSEVFSNVCRFSVAKPRFEDAE
ncbi:MAG TPA: phage minor head protein [Tabrizicola sp.]|nr:phage minor head protein [Tabrizicola sp.]